MAQASPFRSQVPHASTTPTCPATIASTLASIIPTWSSHPLSEIEVSPMSGGLTNSIYKASLPSVDPESVLIRLFGAPDVFTGSQRVTESIIFEQLADASIAPGLLAVMPNGRVEQFLKARNIELHEMTHEGILRGVAKAMARLHKFEPCGVDITRDAAVWLDIGKWIEELGHLAGTGKLVLPEGIFLRECEDGLQKTKEDLEKSASPIVFCHNDLLCGNIMVGEKDNEVSLVDFEYAGFNYRGFDIGNFFCEAMGGTIDGIVREERYPSREQRWLFCHEYLRGAIGTADGVSHEPKDVDALVNEAERFARLAHLYWGLWALVQSVGSTVDFPYLQYAQQRLLLFFEGTLGREKA
eukprot:GFKZ01006376.1.p1 GENE.GFKZ01006376.1~~GFKZ01006376.1.p1  ORF type:complete len:355 (+),score=46.51 GFKZ01006376.1:325-1389(+)